MSVTELSESQLGRMWALIQTYYVDETEERFRESLFDKSHAFLIERRDTGELVGFSCAKLYESESGGKKVRVVFTGDTVISREYWGAGKHLLAMALKFMARAFLKAPWRPLHWFLITKGYKTYLLMSRNALAYYPSHQRHTPPVMRRLIDDLCVERYGAENYDRQRGVLSFTYTRKRVRDGVAEISDGDREHPDIAFFERANPDHRAGDELACVAVINVRQLVVSALKVVGVTCRAWLRRLSRGRR